MVMQPTAPALRARKRRASERGATLLIVLMVLTLLVGIGAFTATSSQLATVSSGQMRHQTQARYVGEYGLMVATSLLAGSGGQSYLKMLGDPKDQCGKAQTGMVMPSCVKIFYADVQNALAAQGYNLCEPVPSATPPNPPAYPGSLGMANAECYFAVELTDKTQGFTPSGFDTAGGKPLKFFYVTATAMGQVRITNPSATTLDTTSAESSSTQMVRSRVLAGPYPAN
jgi:hypothetical protein